ncbi:MAG: class I SAM-dependent methyltransferase [Ornithinimicrobium sp.]|jgi:SAM-dependent methyltransferase|uniref:class I SAM-dependent methyltransferase n=1 Tax=Ornithinimicrobium sp. TaxID=1977084 RepID=UPI003D9BE04F
MEAADWDQRYAGSERVWPAEPNQWVAGIAPALSVGRALDMGAGEGRNAIWLAEQGWTVDATDFSPVAVERMRAWAQDRSEHVEGRLRAWVADATDAATPAGHTAYDLVVQCYLHLVPQEWARAVLAALERTRPGGSVLLIGHAGRNLTDGVGGPQQRNLLFDPDEVEAVVAELPVRVETCEIRQREVPGADRPALDTVALLTRR